MSRWTPTRVGSTTDAERRWCGAPAPCSTFPPPKRDIGWRRRQSASAMLSAPDPRASATAMRGRGCWAPSCAGSAPAGNRLARGAPARSSIFPRPHDHSARLCLYLSSSSFCLPDPGPLASGMDVRYHRRRRQRVRGVSSRVPVARYGLEPPWNSQAPEITGQLRQVPEFQQFALTREACACLHGRAHHGDIIWNSGTLELDREAIDIARLLSSRAVPAPRASWNSASIKIGGGYPLPPANRPDQGLFAGAVGENFRAWRRAERVQAVRIGLELGRRGPIATDAGLPVGNGGNPPLSAGGSGRVGMALLECVEKIERCQWHDVQRRKLGRLCAGRAPVGLEGVPGVSAGSRRGGAPNASRRVARSLSPAIFPDRIGPLFLDGSAMAAIAEPQRAQTGSGARARLCSAARNGAKRGSGRQQDWVRDQGVSGSLRGSNAGLTLGAGVFDVNG